jgi:GT2 family glycosyltransferase
LTEPRIVVLILTKDQRDKTLLCLRHLLKIQEPVFQVLVWDNGSEDGTADAIRAAFPQVFVHRHPSNLGVAGGRNAAAQLAIQQLSPTHLLFLDNDIRVEPGFVRGLLDPFFQVEHLGQTQAKLRFADDPQRLNDAGGCQINFVLGRTRPVGFGEIDKGQYDKPKQCVACGGAMLVRADVFQELGGFDTQFNPFGPEDLDFSLRLSKVGYVALYAPGAVGYHQVSHSYGAGYTENYARHKVRHWFLFLRRHASTAQKAGFYLIGAPYLVLRLILREGRRKNLQAVRGIFNGVFDFLRS